jgi:hypothetical protein
MFLGEQAANGARCAVEPSVLAYDAVEQKRKRTPDGWARSQWFVDEYAKRMLALPWLLLVRFADA